MKGEATFRFGFTLFFYWVKVSSVDLHYAETAKSGGGHTGDAPGLVDVRLMLDVGPDYFFFVCGGVSSQEPVFAETFIWHFLLMICDPLDEYHWLS